MNLVLIMILLQLMILNLFNISNNEPSFYPYSIKVNNCSSSCNNINGPYAKLCVPAIVKNINVKVFNLMSRTNETRHIGWHETCKCKCRLDASICNNKQRWNNEKCRCECKKLIEKGDKGFISNPGNCKCECDKPFDVGKYLDYENCKCRKKLVNKLVEECSENIDGNKVINSGTLNYYENVCNSCTVYILLVVKACSIIIAISSAFIYFHWHLKRDNIHVKFNTNTQKKIY